MERRRLMVVKTLQDLANLNTDRFKAIVPEDESTADEEAGFVSAFNRILDAAMKMKGQMIRKSLKRAKMKCIMPKCEGMWHASLAGPRLHIHLYCDGTCNSNLRE